MDSFVGPLNWRSPFLWLGTLLAFLSVTVVRASNSQSSTITSPDGTIAVTINHDGALTYSLRVHNRDILAPSRLGLKLHDGTSLGDDVELISASPQSVDTSWENSFGKRRTVRNHYNELKFLLLDRATKKVTFQVVFCVFDDGVAFRYVLPAQSDLKAFVVDRDLTEFKFQGPGDYVCYAGEHEKKFRSSQEWQFRKQNLSDIKPESVKGLPVLVETPAAWVAIAEADLLNWPGMWIAGAEKSPDDAKSSALPVTLVAKLAPRLDGEGLVKAETPCQSSWRVLMLARQPGQLIESEIIRNLATPSKLADTSWIKPGKMAWDHWWTGDTIMDTATIESYIQFAADMDWPYQLIDWHWYGDPDKPEADITHVAPELDMDAVRKFAKERHVRLWLWLHSNDVDRNDAWKRAFPLYEQWGIAGVKMDFMDRDDQDMVNWYEKITAAAAEHHLMVNFHGAFKTSGFDRTYPNQITREGILGNEYNKWSKQVTPEHKLTLPFTRLLEGPADFTPGGFLNRQPDQFKTNVKPTEVQGTRAAELALFVCYDSPVCCVCDAPDHIRDQAGADFLKIVPTVWNETLVLDGAVGEHLVMARRSGDDWYLGAMSAGEAREIPVKLDFLGAGGWKLKLWHDAPDSDQNAEHLATDEQPVAAGDVITLKLAPNGGCVGRLQRQ